MHVRFFGNPKMSNYHFAVNQDRSKGVREEGTNLASASDSSSMVSHFIYKCPLFLALCNVTVFPFSQTVSTPSIFGHQPDIKVGVFLQKAHRVSILTSKTNINNQFKTQTYTRLLLFHHHQSPLGLTKRPTNKKNTIQLMQDLVWSCRDFAGLTGSAPIK